MIHFASQPVVMWKPLCLYAVGGLTGALVGLIVKVPVIVWVLIGLMVVDIFMGLGAAYIGKTISAERSWNGLVRKTMTMLLVAATALLAHIFPLPHLAENVEIPAASAIALMFSIHEFISICENAGRAGIPLPPASRGCVGGAEAARQVGRAFLAKTRRTAKLAKEGKK